MEFSFAKRHLLGYEFTKITFFRREYAVIGVARARLKFKNCEARLKDEHDVHNNNSNKQDYFSTHGHDGQIKHRQHRKTQIHQDTY